MSKISVEKLGEAFQAMTVAEVHRTGGLPRLSKEESEFRELMAGFLEQNLPGSNPFDASPRVARRRTAPARKVVGADADPVFEKALTYIRNTGGNATQDADRFLIFMAFLAPATAVRQEELVALFERLSGWEHQRALSAFEVCVVKGFIDKK